MGNSLREFSRRLETLQRVCCPAEAYGRRASLPGRVASGLAIAVGGEIFSCRQELRAVGVGRAISDELAVEIYGGRAISGQVRGQGGTIERIETVRIADLYFAGVLTGGR
jgi:hypothetical protein